MAAASLRTTGTHPTKTIFFPDCPPAAKKGPHCPARGQQGLAALPRWVVLVRYKRRGSSGVPVLSRTPGSLTAVISPVRPIPEGYGEQGQRHQHDSRPPPASICRRQSELVAAFDNMQRPSWTVSEAMIDPENLTFVFGIFPGWRWESRHS